ncbi:MAG: tRNA (guanosine(37)-N1)-methyltransferase TrmD [Bdellovibrionales bacterium]
MIKFQIISLFPDYFSSPLKEGLLAKAIKNKLLEIDFVNPRDFSPTGRVDDYPFGGGDSMIMCYPPLEKSLKSLKNKGRVIFLTPSGSVWNHQKAKNYAKEDEILTLVCGRYGGVDQRFITKYVDEEVSVGDYILNGGEAGALILLESIFRFLPKALGNEKSFTKESFENKNLLECPQWTRPQEGGGFSVPKVLLSGDHQSIEKFRHYSSLVKTSVRRPDLLRANLELVDELLVAQKELSLLSLEELKSLGLKSSDLKLILT